MSVYLAIMWARTQQELCPSHSGQNHWITCFQKLAMILAYQWFSLLFWMIASPLAKPIESSVSLILYPSSVELKKKLTMHAPSTAQLLTPRGCCKNFPKIPKTWQFLGVFLLGIQGAYNNTPLKLHFITWNSV